MFRNFPSYREIIRKRISFISLWKEAYLPSRADGPSTSKGSTGSLIRDQEQESGRTPQTTTEIIACFVAALCLLDTGSVRWMAIVSRVTEIM